MTFPFLFGGTFIEGANPALGRRISPEFPFLFGGTFIEGLAILFFGESRFNFPSFSEGLSLRGPHQLLQGHGKH